MVVSNANLATSLVSHSPSWLADDRYEALSYEATQENSQNNQRTACESLERTIFDFLFTCYQFLPVIYNPIDIVYLQVLAFTCNLNRLMHSSHFPGWPKFTPTSCRASFKTIRFVEQNHFVILLTDQLRPTQVHRVFADCSAIGTLVIKWTWYNPNIKMQKLSLKIL